MKQRLFRSILLLTGAAVGLVLLLFFWLSCQYITQDSFASLKREANLLIVADGEGAAASAAYRPRNADCT